MGGILSLLSSICSAVSSVFGWSKQRSELNNAPDVRKAASEQKEVDAVNTTEKAVEKKDVDEIRKELGD